MQQARNPVLATALAQIAQPCSEFVQALGAGGQFHANEPATPQMLGNMPG